MQKVVRFDQTLKKGLLLLAISGDLILKKDVQGLNFLIKYLEKQKSNVLHEVINQLVSVNSDYLSLLTVEHFNKDISWGRFNKTPFMYAAQSDKHSAYQSLKVILSGEGLLEITENASPEVEGYGVDCNKPLIGNRTVLTYALENSSKSLIDEVLIDVGISLVPRLDTSNRNSFYYLSRNTRLTYQERVDIIAKLLSLNTPILSASFDCSKATMPNELYVCGNAEYAKLDVTLNKAYIKATSKLDDGDKIILKYEQRVWLKNFEECLLPKGINFCYSQRITELDEP